MDVDVNKKTKEELIQEIKNTLNNLGDGDISPSAYDTAWVARIPDKNDPTKPMFPQCLKWVQDNQLSDGSWGLPDTKYYHDRIICTLSSIITLRIWNSELEAIKQGEEYINENLVKLKDEKYLPVGFEALFPSLIKSAKELGINIEYLNPIVKNLEDLFNEKLLKIPLEIIYNQPTTMLHSLEALDGIIDPHKILSLQQENGSFLNSPSSTVFIFQKTGDEKSLDYIKTLLKEFINYVPVNYPLDIFEKLWVLNDIYFLNLEKYFKTEIIKILNEINRSWTKQGLPWSKYVKIPDLDDTAVAFKLSSINNIEISEDVFRTYYNGTTFSCFPGEIQDSPSHIMHLLETYKFIKNKELSKKIYDYSINFLTKAVQENDNGDKWRISTNNIELIKLSLQDNIFNSPINRNLQSRNIYDIAIDKTIWIDKCLYLMPKINSSLLLELSDSLLIELKADFKNDYSSIKQWVIANLSVNEIRILPTLLVGFNILGERDRYFKRIIFSKITLWLFAVDDVFDSNDFTLEDLKLIMNSIIDSNKELINTGKFKEEIIHKLNNLIEILDELYSLIGIDKKTYLQNIVKKTLIGMISEEEKKTSKEIESLTSYLQKSKYSIGTPLVLAFIFSADINFSIYENEINVVYEIAGEITRLLNDIRSFAKEQKEGKINSIGITMNEKKMTQNESLSHINQIILDRMEELEKSIYNKSNVSYENKLLAFQLCQTTGWFYKKNDFHDYTKELFQDLLNNVQSIRR